MALQGWYYFPYFIEEEIGVQRWEETCWGHWEQGALVGASEDLGSLPIALHSLCPPNTLLSRLTWNLPTGQFCGVFSNTFFLFSTTLYSSNFPLREWANNAHIHVIFDSLHREGRLTAVIGGR